MFTMGMRILLPILVAKASSQNLSSTPDCNTHNDCFACTSSASWAPGVHCGWCANDHKCHAFWSFYNPCGFNTIHDATKCPGPVPSPTPTRPDPYSGWLKEIVTAFFQALKITNVDVDTCVTDISRAAGFLKNFEGDMSSRRYPEAMADLSRALYGLSTSVSACDVAGIEQKIDAFAAAVHWANITQLDAVVKILIGASELTVDLGNLASAIKSGSGSEVGEDIGKLLQDWSAVTDSCSDGDFACKLVDGLLRVVKAEVASLGACEAALKPAVNDFTAAGNAFQSGDYKGAVGDVAAGLDAMALALTNDACGLKTVADIISNVSPKLKDVIVEIEQSKAVKIIVGSADVYEDLYAAFEDVKREDWSGVGIQMGLLLAKLRASGCKTQACIIVDGIIASLQVGFTDLTACHNDIDATWGDINTALTDAEQRKWSESLTAMGNFFGSASQFVGACGIPQFASIFEKVAQSLDSKNGDRIAEEIAGIEQIFVAGADVFADFQQIIIDFQKKNWAGLGHDLGSLSDWIAQTFTCNRFSCLLVEGLLQQADILLTDLKPCEDELKKVEGSFHAGIVAWKAGQPLVGLKQFATGLSEISDTIDACGITKELNFIKQEANVLGLGNLTILNGVISVLVHGQQFGSEVGQGFTYFFSGDYRDAAQELGKAMNDLSKWTTGHLCTSPVCYIVNGVLQYFQDLASDVKTCGNDLEDEWKDFGNAFKALGGNGSVWKWDPSVQNIKKGVADVGQGLHALAASVSDCHLAQLAEIIEALAVKLGLVPEVAWVEELLHILIDGVEIVDELASACTDYANSNWPAFGYEIVKIISSFVSEGKITLPESRNTTVYV